MLFQQKVCLGLLFGPAGAHTDPKSAQVVPPPLVRARELEVQGTVDMIPGQLIAPGQLTDPRVNFASVHGLTPVTVHMSFSLPWGNFERRLTLCTTPGNPALPR